MLAHTAAQPHNLSEKVTRSACNQPLFAKSHLRDLAVWAILSAACIHLQHSSSSSSSSSSVSHVTYIAAAPNRPLPCCPEIVLSTYTRDADDTKARVGHQGALAACRFICQASCAPMVRPKTPAIYTAKLPTLSHLGCCTASFKAIAIGMFFLRILDTLVFCNTWSVLMNHRTTRQGCCCHSQLADIDGQAYPSN
jgi:hypothetical protein